MVSVCVNCRFTGVTEENIFLPFAESGHADSVAFISLVYSNSQ